jgi:hypothetical protein
MRHDTGLHEGPASGINWKWRGASNGLKSAGLARSRRDGKMVMYELTERALALLGELARNTVSGS